MKHLLLIILFLPFIFQGTVQGQPASAAHKVEIQPVLTVYPNPCKDKKIIVELKNEELSEIKITNITGKEVFLQKLFIPVNKIQIELNTIPNGIIFYKPNQRQIKPLSKNY